MSKVAPTSSAPGKQRRVTANWAFESASRSNVDLQSAVSNRRTLQVEMSDARKLEVSLNADNILCTGIYVAYKL